MGNLQVFLEILEDERLVTMDVVNGIHVCKDIYF